MRKTPIYPGEVHHPQQWQAGNGPSVSESPAREPLCFDLPRAPC